MAVCTAGRCAPSGPGLPACLRDPTAALSMVGTLGRILLRRPALATYRHTERDLGPRGYHRRGAFGLALQNGQLLSQSEAFESSLALRRHARSGGREQGVQQGKHRGLVSSTPNAQTSTMVRSTGF
jgi:hypothetical protein